MDTGRQLERNGIQEVVGSIPIGSTIGIRNGRPLVRGTGAGAVESLPRRAIEALHRQTGSGRTRAARDARRPDLVTACRGLTPAADSSIRSPGGVDPSHPGAAMDGGRAL